MVSDRFGLRRIIVVVAVIEYPRLAISTRNLTFWHSSLSFALDRPAFRLIQSFVRFDLFWLNSLCFFSPFPSWLVCWLKILDNSSGWDSCRWNRVFLSVFFAYTTKIADLAAVNYWGRRFRYSFWILYRWYYFFTRIYSPPSVRFSRSTNTFRFLVNMFLSLSLLRWFLLQILEAIFAAMTRDALVIGQSYGVLSLSLRFVRLVYIAWVRRMLVHRLL